MNLKPDKWTESGYSSSVGPQLTVTQLTVTQAAFFPDATR